MIKSSTRYKKQTEPTTASHKAEDATGKRLVYVTGWVRCPIREIKGRFKKAFFSLRKLLNFRWVSLTTLEVLMTEEYSQEFLFKMKKLEGYLTVTTEFNLLRSPNMVDTPENRQLSKQRFIRNLVTQMESTTKPDVAEFFFSLLKEQGVFTLRAAEAMVKADTHLHPDKNFGHILHLFSNAATENGPTDTLDEGSHLPLVELATSALTTTGYYRELSVTSAGVTEVSRATYLIYSSKLPDEEKRHLSDTIQLIVNQPSALSLRPELEFIRLTSSVNEIADTIIDSVTNQQEVVTLTLPDIILSLGERLSRLQRGLVLLSGLMDTINDEILTQKIIELEEPCKWSLTQAEALIWLDEVEPHFSTDVSEMASCLLKSYKHFSILVDMVNQWFLTRPKEYDSMNDTDYPDNGTRDEIGSQANPETASQESTCDDELMSDIAENFGVVWDPSKSWADDVDSNPDSQEAVGLDQ
jgi:hypothetical protein